MNRLVRNLIFRLRQEEKSHNNSINFANKEIQILQTDQKKLIERYSKRIIKAYKKGTLSNIEKIASLFSAEVGLTSLLGTSILVRLYLGSNLGDAIFQNYYVHHKILRRDDRKL